MNFPFFLAINYFCFTSLLVLFSSGFKEEARIFAKYLFTFFFGMLVMEVIA